eukprot:Selendium_serpulae@DN6097_c0_g2_i1.p1
MRSWNVRSEEETLDMEKESPSSIGTADLQGDDPVTALFVAQLARATYFSGSYPDVLPVLWSMGTTEYVEIRGDESIAYVIFRGSDDAIDWIRNGDFHLVETDAGAINHGMVSGWIELERGILLTLSAMRELRTIVCVGHSRGAPLAIQCHYTLSKFRPAAKVITITLGCPQFCDDKFVKSTSDLSITNYVAGRIPLLRDPICHIAPGQKRPGRDIILRGYGAPVDMHVLSRYIISLEKLKNKRKIKAEIESY